MGRTRPRLTVLPVVAALTFALSLTACTTSGAPVATSTTGTSTTSAAPTGAGYPLAKGRQVMVTKGQTGTVTLAVSDVLAAPRPAMGTHPSGDVLVLAEVTDTQLIYQAVAQGKATLATDDPPRRSCPATPCPPSGAAPPVVTVAVT